MHKSPGFDSTLSISGPQTTNIKMVLVCSSKMLRNHCLFWQIIENCYCFIARRMIRMRNAATTSDTNTNMHNRRRERDWKHNQHFTSLFIINIIFLSLDTSDSSKIEIIIWVIQTPHYYYYYFIIINTSLSASSLLVLLLWLLFCHWGRRDSSGLEKNRGVLFCNG